MTRWQRRARLLIALFGIVFIIVVALAFRKRTPPPSVAAITRTDPTAIVETTGGTTQRFKGVREDVGVDYEKLLTYKDGSSKMLGVTVHTGNRGGRSFTVKAKQADLGNDESSIALTGDVRLEASDGFNARTERATYESRDGVVRAGGPIQFSRGRMTGSGIGMTYDKDADVLVILDKAVVHVLPEKGDPASSADMSATKAEFRRRDKQVFLDGGVKVLRGAQTIESDTATATLTADEKHVDALELRGHSRISGSHPTAGGLEALNGRDMDLKYADDGETLQHALIVGGAVMQFAGEQGRHGRRISAETIDVTLAPDGTTPTLLIGRDNVVLVFPAEPNVGARTVRSKTLDAKGEPGRGLTNAHFADAVEYREANAGGERVVRAAVLDAALKPGGGSIEEARFSRSVRFADGPTSASAASARYVLDRGLLQLTGTEPATPTPHMVNERIAIDATQLDVTLDGPKVKATGNVKSVLQPAKPAAQAGAPAGASGDVHMPGMLKQDQPVNVTAGALDYDGTASKAVYTGQAQLWQADTTIRADTLVVDDKSGDLTGSGSVATSVMLEEIDNEKKTKQRARSVGTSTDFKYEDDIRRATYTGDAHLTGSEGEITAAKIELYLKPSGDELDRAEAYTGVTLHESARRTTGDRMTYFAADQRYLVTGTPVKIVDECERETIGRTLTFYRSTDTILVDGNQRIRTQTKGGGKCSGS